MNRSRERRTWSRIACIVAIATGLALGMARPARATFFASSQLCYGFDCSEQGYATPLPSVSDSFQRDVFTGEPGPTGTFELDSSADVAARVVTFEVGFTGNRLVPDVFLAGFPPRVLIAFMGAVGEDELTITAPGLTTGFVSLDIVLQAGGIDGCTAVSGCSAGLPFVSPTLAAQFFAQAGGQSAAGQGLDESQLTVTGGFAQEYASPQIFFTAGVPFSVRLGVSGTMSLAELLDPMRPDLFLSGGTLGVTATIVRLRVFDASRVPVENPTIVSETGTDWTTAVPEASGAPTGLAVLAALGLVARRSLRPCNG